MSNEALLANHAERGGQDRARNIVLCCDGTANEFAQARTNVVKLFQTLVQNSNTQVVYYHPGLGTMEPLGALNPISKRITRALGRAFGYGLETDVRDAYVFLMRQFENGDRVFMFGFSRGAYTVRAVASLLHMYGLIPQGNEPLVPYAIRMLSAINKIDNRRETGAYFGLAKDFKQTFGDIRPCKPWFIGVWDTVASVGWVENPVRLPYTADNPDIQTGRHAISIDERRAFFRTNLWRPKLQSSESGPLDLMQVWFPGVHSGGYPEDESGLSKIALQWMLEEAIKAGLLIELEKMKDVLGERGGRYVKPDPNGTIHESLRSWWWLAEILRKRHFDWNTKTWRWRMNLASRRTIPPGSQIHRSAYERGDNYAARLPSDVQIIG
jgi:uncharacterized protein (DUF2235 family)